MYAHVCVYSETYIYMHIYMCIFDCRLDIAKISTVPLSFGDKISNYFS